MITRREVEELRDMNHELSLRVSKLESRFFGSPSPRNIDLEDIRHKLAYLNGWTENHYMEHRDRLSKQDFILLCDYLRVEIKDTPARREVVKKEKK